MSVCSASINTSEQRPFNVLISNDVKFIDKVVGNLQSFIKRHQQYRFSLAEIRQLIIKASETINKRGVLDTTEYQSGRVQSVSWHFINEFLDCNLDTDLSNALNTLLLQLSVAFDRIGDSVSTGIALEHIDVARDLNETMKLLNIPIHFHGGVYGKTDDTLRTRTGRSALRRPIAKAELVLSWAAYLLRLTRKPDRFTPSELTFINILGAMLDIFVKRFDLIINIKYHQPCIDHLAFIRLMELVYVTCIRTVGMVDPLRVYASFYDIPPQFKYIQDFSDIRLGLKGVKSFISRLPRNPSSHSWKDSVFYNPVKCEPESPIYAATEAWENAKITMQVDTDFDTIVKETAIASFSYEHSFGKNRQEIVQEPNWYRDVTAFTITDSDDRELYEQQVNVIRDTLKPIEDGVKEIVPEDLPGMTLTETGPKIIFSVMLKSNEKDKPTLSFIEL